MNSSHVTHLITDYIDASLPVPTMEKVKSHLVFCNACRQFYSEIKKNAEVLKSTPLIDPPKGLEQRILRALSETGENTSDIKSRPAASSNGWNWFFSYRGLGLAATAVFLVFFVRNVPQMMKDTKTQFDAPSAPQTETFPEEKRLIEKQNRADEKLLAHPEPKKAEQDVPSAMLPAPDIERKSPDAVISDIKETSEQMRKLKAPVAAAAQQPFVSEVESLQESNKTALSEERTRQRRGILDGSGAPLSLKKDLAAGAPPALDSALLGGGKTISYIENKLMNGSASGIKEPMEKLISDQKSWEEFWRAHQSGMGNSTPPPSIDFSTEEIAVILAGPQPSAGYRIEIVKIITTQWENAPARIVRYRVQGPSPSAMVAQMITTPYLFKVLPKEPGPVFFKRIR